MTLNYSIAAPGMTVYWFYTFYTIVGFSYLSRPRCSLIGRENVILIADWLVIAQRCSASLFCLCFDVFLHSSTQSRTEDLSGILRTGEQQHLGEIDIFLKYD